jgi:anti-sigma regulatory factor (Ser/Thr protein kinase)
MSSVEPLGSDVSIEPSRGSTTDELREEATMQLVLPPSTGSVRRARHFIEECMGEATEADVLEVAVLLTSELVSNAVLHGGPFSASASVRLSVELLAGRLRVGVEDASQAMPVVGDGAPTSVEGRGLLLVESLADRWGCEPLAGGKVVWFELVTSLVDVEIG